MRRYLKEDLLHDLGLIAPVYAVLGNCDWNLWILPAKRIVSCGRYKIGLTHGYLGRGKDTPERAFNTFADEHVDVIVFGHSHIPYHEVREGIILFNPGSPTQKRGHAQYSMGILKIFDHGIIAEHIFFERS
jgi:putative phosphoesterase